MDILSHVRLVVQDRGSGAYIVNFWLQMSHLWDTYRITEALTGVEFEFTLNNDPNSVVGAMCAVVDDDRPGLARHFYESIFSGEEMEAPPYQRSALALRNAVQKLRRKRGVTLERLQCLIDHLNHQ